MMRRICFVVVTIFWLLFSLLLLPPVANVVGQTEKAKEKHEGTSFATARGGKAPPEGLVEIIGPVESDKVRLDQYEETKNYLQIVVDTELPIRGIVLRPKIFSICKGDLLLVNGNRILPGVVHAEKDGEIRFPLTASINGTFVLEHYRGIAPEKLGWKNASFENSKPGMIPDDYTPFLLPRGAKGCTASVSRDCARTGKQSLKLRVDEAGVNISGVRTRETFDVEAGERYLFSGWHRANKAVHGAKLVYMLTIRSDNLPEKNIFGPRRPLIDLGEDWTRLFFEVAIPRECVNPRLALLVYVYGSPCTYYLDDFTVIPLPKAAPQYTRPQTTAQMTPKYSEQEVRSFWSKHEPWTAQYSDRSSGWEVGGKPLTWFGFTSTYWANRWPSRSAHQDFFQRGVDLHWISIQTSSKTNFGGPIWRGKGDYDFSPLEKRLTALLRFNPNAKIGLYLSLDPYDTFCEEFPNAAWRDHLGQRYAGNLSDVVPITGPRKKGSLIAFSYTAIDYRREASDYAFQLGRFLANSDVGKAVVGIHMVAGFDGQWGNWNWCLEYDHSKGGQDSFRDWIRRRYKGDVEALRKEWGDQELTFETVSIPDEKDRDFPNYLMDPNVPAHHRVRDANRFLWAGPVETLDMLASALKRGIGKNIFVSVYYPSWNLAFKELMGSRYIDGIVGVTAYGGYREAGATGSIKVVFDSVALRQKFFLNEMDFRTELASTRIDDAWNFKQKWCITYGEEEGRATVFRELASGLVHRGGAWIYSLPENSWNAPRHMEYIEEAQKMADRLRLSNVPDHYGKVTLFVDQESIDLCSVKKNYYRHLFGYGFAFDPQTALFRSGVSSNYYLLDDLMNPCRPDSKVCIFLLSATLTEEQVRYIENNLQKDGRILVFFYNAGYGTPGGFEKTIQRLTKLPVHIDFKPKAPIKLAVTGTDPLNRSVVYNTPEIVGPVCYLNESELGEQDRVLARIVGTKRVGAAVHREKGWTSVYIAAPGALSPQQIRNFVKEVGLEPDGPEGDVVHSGNGIFVIHAISEGEKKLSHEKTCRWLDAVSGKVIAENAASITIPMKRHETRVFQLQ